MIRGTIETTLHVSAAQRRIVVRNGHGDSAGGWQQNVTMLSGGIPKN
jgi:hypothetical protein